MTSTAGASPTIRTVAWPKWFSNPYLPRLLDALRDQGIDASARSLGLGTRPLRAGDWLHLHWPGETHAQLKARPLYRAHAAVVTARLRSLRRRGVRIAWTAHNLVPHDDPQPDLGKRARADMLALVDHVFVHFDSARTSLNQTFGYSGPTTLVPHPHFIDDYPPPPARDAARAQLGLPQDGVVFLMFGRIRPYKGVGDTIEAFCKIAGDRDRLVIAGVKEGPVADELGLARGDERIIVHDRLIPHDDVSVYYGAADVAVTAHRVFFTSSTALLALSMGVPIVGPPLHHLADLTGDGRMFPIGNGPNGLAVALADARDAAPGTDRAAIRAWAATLGDWNDAAAKIASVFRS